MEQKIFDLLLEEEELSWKTLLYDIVTTEGMDPWDINITALTQKYIHVIKELQEYDLRISGKVLLAAAFLLKIKSAHFLETDISNLDRLLNQPLDEEMEDQMLEHVQQDLQRKGQQQFKLIPRNPQPRNRKMSIHDLVEALQRAMATKKKILSRQRPTPFIIPERKMDIMDAIRDVYHKIVYYTQKEESKLTFKQLLPPRAGKPEKVYTFIPLLHLENQQKINTEQEKPFDEIIIRIAPKK